MDPRLAADGGGSFCSRSRTELFVVAASGAVVDGGAETKIELRRLGLEEVTGIVLSSAGSIALLPTADSTISPSSTPLSASSTLRRFIESS